MSGTGREVFRIFIRGTMQAVWHEITKLDEPQQCFFNNFMRTDGLKVGGKIRMRSPDDKYTGVVGEILEFDPPRRFAHTFKFTNYDDPECTVIYTLKPKDDGVEFELILENLPLETKTAKQMKQGGTMIINTLKAMVENGRPSFGTRMLFVLFKLMGPLSPAQCRSENWPL